MNMVIASATLDLDLQAQFNICFFFLCFLFGLVFGCCGYTAITFVLKFLSIPPARGRFMADDYFTILHGEQWTFETGKFVREVYRPGDLHLMRRGVSKQYRMLSDCWALEYARGNIFSMLPFGLLDTFTSTMDLVTLYQTARVALRGIVSNLLRGKV